MLCVHSMGDGWMTCEFTSFLTVFQSYQDDGWVIMNGCVQWNLVCGWKDFRGQSGPNPGPLEQYTSA